MSNVLNEEFPELNEKEIINYMYDWLIRLFLLDFPIEDIPIEFFKKNNCRILFSEPDKIKEYIIKQQEKRKNEFKDMVFECFFEGESKKFNFMRSRDNDYILEIKLIKSEKKVEEYYE